MQQVQVGNLSLAYEEKGAGQAIVMVHGIPTDYRAWSSQLESLSPFYRTVSISRRHAYPNTNATGVLESTVQNNSEDLVGFLQKLNLKSVHLIGHSYGGFIALYTAWKSPELFRSLVLIEPSIPSILVKNEKNPLQVLAFLLTHYSAATSARRFQTGMLKLALKSYDEGDKAAAVKCFYEGIRETPGSFEKLQKPVHDMLLDNSITIGELETEFPILTKEDARKVKLPTLLVKGEKSPKWLQAIVEGLAKNMPNSAMIQISGSGHFSHIENPAELNPQILAFLEKNDGQ